MAFVTMEKRPDTAPFPPRPTKARLLPQDALQGSARIEQALGKLKRFERVALRCEKTKRLCNPRSPSPPASSCSNPSTRPRLDTQCVSNLDTELHGPIGAIPRRMITEKRIRDLEAAMAVKAKLRSAPRCWETCKCQKIEWCPMPESNQHSFRNSILSRARLPIPPMGLEACVISAFGIYTIVFAPVNREVSIFVNRVSLILCGTDGIACRPAPHRSQKRAGG